MKLRKKTVTILSFALGTTLFLSTAFADVLIGSGYEQLKGSVKNTASQLEKELNNYTVEMVYTAKDNGETFMQGSEKVKIDNAQKAMEQIRVTQDGDKSPVQSYTYNDETRTIQKNDGDDAYYVVEFDQPRNQEFFSNPFNNEREAELEKVFDAIVGNLKDYVQTEENPNGGKTYTASLSEAQVPALINAVASVGMKEFFSDRSGREDSRIPQIKSDIYVKKAAGIASEQKNGLLDNMTGELVLSGKDKDGNPHDLAVSIMLKLTGIGETKITVPDLTNAHVDKLSQSSFGFSSKFIGTYMNTIILEKNGQFVKAGERILEITGVDQDKVTGTYNEVLTPGFEAELGGAISFTFESNLTAMRERTFTYTQPDGKQGEFWLYPNTMGTINMNMDAGDMAKKGSARQFNLYGEFTRVFE